MGKLPELDAFDRGQIVGARRMGHFTFRNCQTARNFKINSVKSIPRIHKWWTKNSNRAKWKGQLALTVRETCLWESSTYESTIAQCSPSDRTSCLGKRAQRLECRGLETSSIE
ncbi:hypothetical protein TNCV_1590441 [Trichonephila clavipes]|nr:hypothetical protein TNCV_1590441 [Trichonephila clavipes]